MNSPYTYHFDNHVHNAVLHMLCQPCVCCHTHPLYPLPSPPHPFHPITPIQPRPLPSPPLKSCVLCSTYMPLRAVSIMSVGYFAEAMCSCYSNPIARECTTVARLFCNLSCCCVYNDGTLHAMQKQRQATHVWKPLEATSDINRHPDWRSQPDAQPVPMVSSADSAVQSQEKPENITERQIKQLPITHSEQLPQKLPEQQQVVQHAVPLTVGTAVDPNHAPRCVSSHLLLPLITHFSVLL